MGLPGVLKTYLPITSPNQKAMYLSLSGFLIAVPALAEPPLGFQPLRGTVKKRGAVVKHQALNPGERVPVPGLSLTV